MLAKKPMTGGPGEAVGSEIFQEIKRILGR